MPKYLQSGPVPLLFESFCRKRLGMSLARECCLGSIIMAKRYLAPWGFKWVLNLEYVAGRKVKLFSHIENVLKSYDQSPSLSELFLSQQKNVKPSILLRKIHEPANF